MIEGHSNGGLYDAEEQLCPNAENFTHEHRPDASLDPTEAKQTRPGRYLYAELVHNLHFGHVLTEGLSRLWGLDHAGALGGILCQA